MAGKVYTYAEVAAHSAPGDAWFIIDGKVYDISKFADEHPGGDEIILDNAGTDATGAFVDIGHSDEALRLLKGLHIGEVDVNSERVEQARSTEQGASSSTESRGLLVMVIGGILFALAYHYFNNVLQYSTSTSI